MTQILSSSNPFCFKTLLNKAIYALHLVSRIGLAAQFNTLDFAIPKQKEFNT
jgi:hypothetical protein